jgi:hypothetical protein
MTAHHFTDEDRFEPAYCTGCRRHLPKAELDRAGRCLTCQAHDEYDETVTAQARQAEEARRQQVAAASQAATRQTTTGMERWPRCGSRDIRPFTVDTGVEARRAATAARGLGCSPLGAFVLLTHLAGVLGGRAVKQTRYRCGACSHEWWPS